MFDFSEMMSEPFVIMRLFGTVLLTLVLSYAAGVIIKRLQQRFKHNHLDWDDVLLDAMRGPVKLMIWVVGLGTALSILDVEIKDWGAILNSVRRLGVIVSGAWFAFRFAGAYERVLIQKRQAEHEHGKHDPTGIMAIGRLLRAAILITAGLVVLETLGFSVSGVLAFGGVGGIAVGFAAKDLLANFFGGLMIFLDRPFSVGDWVKSPDREIEGIVEKIGWRMTVVRSFEKQPLYIPNSTFSSITVVNPSRMTHRRIKETIGLRYDDIRQLPAIVQAIRELLSRHEALDGEQSNVVFFERFGESTLDILLQCYTATTVWVEYLAVKEALLLAVSDIIERHGAQIAFPTQTLHLASLAPIALQSGPADESESGVDRGQAESQR